MIKKAIKRHSLLIFLMAVVGLAVVMVLISMRVYYTSKAYQLDLSRPEYKAVRSQIARDPENKDIFASQGEITEDVLNDFLERYKTEVNPVRENPAFAKDVLSDEQLGL